MIERRRSPWLAFLLVGSGACNEVESPACEVEVEAVIEVSGTVCAVTPTGLVVRLVGPHIVLETLDSSEGWRLVELARVDGASSPWCPAATQDPSTRTIWLARGPDEFEAPAELLRFTADGTWVASELLSHEGEPVAVESLLARDGALTIAGAVHDEDAPDWHVEQAFLQRRDELGQVLWTRIGFAGLSPYLQEAGLAFHWVEFLVPLRSQTAMLAMISYLDTTSITLLTVDNESGEVVGVEPAMGGTFWNTFPRLGSDGDRNLLIATDRDPRHAEDPEHPGDFELIQPARSVVAASDGYGWIAWWTEHELSGWHDLRSTQPVANHMSVFNVVSGTEVPNTHHVSVVRYDWTGAVDCTVSLDGAGLRDGQSLTRFGERTLVLSASVATGFVDDWDREELLPVLAILDAPVAWPAWASPE